MQFCGAVRFTACLLHIFKTEKTYPAAVSVLEVYVAFVLFSFFFPQLWFCWAAAQAARPGSFPSSHV